MTRASATSSGVRASRLVALAIVSVVLSGCVSDLGQDQQIRSARDRHAWSIPAQRRLVYFILPVCLTFDRDTFHSVGSDGERFIAALASQHSESWPHAEYLYLIDGACGKLLHVLPVGPCFLGDIRVADGHIIVKQSPGPCGPSEELRVVDPRITIVRTSDGVTILDRNGRDLGLSDITSIGVQGGIVRVHGWHRGARGTASEQDVYIDVKSGKQLNSGAAMAQLANVAYEAGVSIEEILNAAKPLPIVPFKDTVRCGSLAVNCRRGWLVADRPVQKRGPGNQEED